MLDKGHQLEIDKGAGSSLAQGQGERAHLPSTTSE